VTHGLLSGDTNACLRGWLHELSESERHPERFANDAAPQRIATPERTLSACPDWKGLRSK
jgi:hypothetical protein